MLSGGSRPNNDCSHDVYIKGLCGNCGARLDPPKSNSLSMIHSVPELKVSEHYAKEIGKDDQERLIQERRLVLLVDLDQTILHTTHEEVRNDPNVLSFVLWPGHPTYYTKLRPFLKEFLEEVSKMYELHIFTFGCRRYAHKIASIIDPEQKYFGNRILSRDESVDQFSKKGNLANLFPCGDSMVCIIDDRSDVWKNAGNLIQVQAYSYFKTSISDGAHRSISLEEEEKSLERDVDMLEALLDSDNDDDGGPEVEGDNETKQHNQITTEPEPDDSSGEAVSKLDQPEAEQVLKEEEEEVKGKAELEDEADSDSEEVSDDKSLPEDHDSHLLHLIEILERIHSKWYLELDEQRRFLSEGESYKLPDTEDIIKRYLRKRF